jgi:hypothetical protein
MTTTCPRSTDRPNVTLVDTLGRGVDRVTETGLVFDNIEYEVDCIIFATGFEVGTAYTRRSGFEIYGRDGRKLTDYWSSACALCTAFTAMASRIVSTLGLPKTPLRRTFRTCWTNRRATLVMW